MSNQSTELQKGGEKKTLPPTTSTDNANNRTQELIRTGGSMVTILMGVSFFLTWFYNLSPLLFIPLTAVLISLAFVGLYYYKINPEFLRLETEKQSLNETLESKEETVKELPETNENPPVEEKLVEKTPLSERPNIITSLVIDDVSESKVDFHLLLENRGKVVAKNIRVSLKTNKHSGVEKKPSMVRDLVPEGKFTLPQIAPEIIIPNETNSLVVTVSYNVENNGKKIPFFQTIRFLIRAKDIKPQTIYPEAWDEKEGIPPEEDEVTRIWTQFADQKGTLFIRFPAIKSDGSPQTVNISNLFRSFSFDPIMQVVSFKTKTLSGRLVSLDLPILLNEKNLHKVTIIWNSYGGALMIDGVKKKDFENETE